MNKSPCLVGHSTYDGMILPVKDSWGSKSPNRYQSLGYSYKSPYYIYIYTVYILIYSYPYMHICVYTCIYIYYIHRYIDTYVHRYIVKSYIYMFDIRIDQSTRV